MIYTDLRGNGLFHVRREERRLVKRAHRVVCFSAAELVKGLVHAASRSSALFPSDDHPAAPCHGFTYRNRFDYTERDVSVQVGFDLLLPV